MAGGLTHEVGGGLGLLLLLLAVIQQLLRYKPSSIEGRPGGGGGGLRDERRRTPSISWTFLPQKSLSGGCQRPSRGQKLPSDGLRSLPRSKIAARRFEVAHKVKNPGQKCVKTQESRLDLTFFLSSTPCFEMFLSFTLSLWSAALLQPTQWQTCQLERKSQIKMELN